MIRYVIIAIVILAIIPVGWLAWYLLSPLVSTTTVNEEFPLAARAAVPQGMTMAQVEAVMQEAVEAAPAPVVEAMPELPGRATPSAMPVAQLAGSFEDADAFHRGSGTATIYDLGADGGSVLRLEDFRVTNGPDLRVLLANIPNPSDRSRLNAGGYEELAQLKGNAGSQNYDIPDSVNLDEIRSVVIYCRPFQVVFSVATLTPPDA